MESVSCAERLWQNKLPELPIMEGLTRSLSYQLETTRAKTEFSQSMTEVLSLVFLMLGLEVLNMVAWIFRLWLQ